MLINHLNRCCSLFEQVSFETLNMIQTISVENKENKIIFSTAEVKSWLHPQRHRWAEHRGVLVLCSRAGNNACKKLLGVCANSPAFFFQRREDGSQGHSQTQSCGHRWWQQLNFSLDCLPLFFRQRVLIALEIHRILVTELGYHGRRCVSLKEKQNESSLPFRASLLLSLLLQTQKWELHVRVHPSQFIPPHWRASPRGCDCETSWIPGFKSRMIESFLSGSFKTLKTEWFVLTCEWEYKPLLQHDSSIDLQVLCEGGQH